jgi:hypothetical protein
LDFGMGKFDFEILENFNQIWGRSCPEKWLENFSAVKRPKTCGTGSAVGQIRQFGTGRYQKGSGGPRQSVHIGLVIVLFGYGATS